MMKRVLDSIQPYSLQDFIEDHNPQTVQEVEELEKLWYYHNGNSSFSNPY